MTPTTASTVTDSIRSRQPETTRSGLLLQRIRAEFIEMPGLTLTLPQAARLWGLTAPQTEAILSELIARGLLTRDRHGSYRRRGCPRCS